MVYQAILVLLAYKWLSKQTEVGVGSVVLSTFHLSIIYLSGDAAIHTKGLVTHSISIPGLKSGTSLTKFLQNPLDMMRVASEIRIVKTRGSEEITPRLVVGLLKLPSDIAAIISDYNGEQDIVFKP